MTITDSQARAARAHLSLTIAELSKKTGIGPNPLSAFERGVSGLSLKNITKIESFYKENGIEFIENNGIREKHEMIIYREQNGFRKFMDDVYRVASTEGGEICLYNARPSNWIKWLGKEWYANHTKRMQEALKEKDFYFKVTAQTGDYNFIGGKHSEYRWVPDEMFNQQSFYVYGDRLALLSFGEESLEIFVVKKQQFANSFRQLFNIAWENITTIPDSDNYKPNSYK